MKKILILVISIFLFSILVGCNSKDDTDDKYKFTANVVEIRADGYVLVEPLDGDILSVLDENNILFNASELDVIDVSIGDTISITYIGGIMESLPPQITVQSWSILKKDKT